ncbi:MAG: bifunctional folylpolyglutamate synthase/dihydrofolate synthase [Rhodospirillales bacterium]|jgi:dihydrofolate synthase / folylpolyglutamate synthase
MRTLPQKPDTVLDRLTGLHPKLIDLSFDRIEHLLERLGNPHHNLPPVVHVAGTNGKGSTIAFMRACLEAAGYRVHVYTSPHLVRFNERIEIAGKIIPDNVLVSILEECEAANGSDPITFFEITTVAAFLAFSRYEADIVLLETGLGGRLDATNLIAKPALTVITPISIDHQQFLGDTLAEIAAEKAGILKAGVTCVVAAQPAAAANVIKQQANAVGAPLLWAGTDFSFNAAADPFTVTLGSQDIALPRPALNGPHQYQNAALAIAGLKQLQQFSIDDAALALGLQTVQWPARMQRLGHGPLTQSLPAGWTLWLDGGHNQAAGQVIAEQCGQWSDQSLYLIFGMLNTKDPIPYLTPIKPYAQNLYALAIPGEAASLSATALQAAAQEVGFSAMAVPSVAAALDHICENETKPSRILICGSLYLAGTVLKENREELQAI